jgi:hypothetical protein
MKGLDISFSKPSAQWWRDRYAEGYRIAVQNLWTGGFASNEGIKAVAATNLRNARLAGFRVAAYANASPPDWWPLATQLQHIKANAGAEWAHIKDVVVDVEIDGITKARVMELADGLEAAGKTADVLYTGRWFWVGHMGDSMDPAWRRFRLWSAHYDWNPDIDFGSNPYGPWGLGDVIGEQYRGSTNVAGGTIDLNTFRASWMAPAPPPPPPEPTPEPTPEPEPPDEEEAMKPAFVKVKDTDMVYAVERDRLVHVVGPAHWLLTRGAEYALREVDANDTILDLPVLYPLGVPEELRS